MSAQTGIESPSGPASRRIGDRVKHRIERWRSEPNPLWMREMRQSARLTRTPIVLMVVSVLMTLAMGALGGLLSGNTSPAKAGVVIFQTFFSLAYFVVALVGPALAANSIASEREGRTWEAVLLTGIRPEAVARGKFMSAFTSIAMYVVMLAPVGALPFLFGGVTPLEVLIAFVVLFLIALLAVAFGLAISAKMQSMRGAILVTLLAAVPLSGFAFSTFGVGGSLLAHQVWRGVLDEGVPIWLPVAIASAPFGFEYALALIVAPLCLLGLPTWLLYEITRANLTSVTDDRSVGLKRWYLATAALLTVGSLATTFAVPRNDAIAALIACGFVVWLFVLFGAFLFAGEEIGPSRRVKKMLAGESSFRRFIGPGVIPTTRLQLVGALGSFALLLAVGLAYDATLPHTRAAASEELLYFSAYAIAFSLFAIGLAALLRARAKQAGTARVLLLVLLFLVTAGPWVLAAMTGMMTSGGKEALAVAAPSPIYLAIALESVSGTASGDGAVVVAGLVVAALYAALGIAFAVAARRQCRAIIDEHERVLSDADRLLAEEDAAVERMREEARQAALRAAEQPAVAHQAASRTAGFGSPQEE